MKREEGRSLSVSGSVCLCECGLSISLSLSLSLLVCASVCGVFAQSSQITPALPKAANIAKHLIYRRISSVAPPRWT